MNIIVVSYIGSPWLSDCLNSLKECKYPIHVAINTKAHNHYESAGLKLGRELGKPFVLLQDSVVVKDLAFLDTMNTHNGPMAFAEKYLMYLGKYIPGNWQEPDVNDKAEAVAGELTWCRDMSHGVAVLCPEFRDTRDLEVKHGKQRMRIENQYLIKWKNCWDTNMIPTADKVQ